MKIVLFTSAFPYGSGEQFLETEINFLAEKFESIIIIPASYGNSKVAREIPKNVNVKVPILINSFKRVFNFRLINFLFNYRYMKIIIKDFLNALRKSQLKLFFIALNISYYSSNEPYLKKILKEVSKEDILYFYWGHGQTFILPFIGYVKAKKVIRLHRSDLYENLNNDYFPFRKAQLESVDNIFLISSHGLEYLSTKYPSFKDKMKIFRLGTINKENVLEKKENVDFHIVSCSSLTNVKRVHLIVEVLSNLDSKIRWTHFGSGDLKEILFDKTKKLKDNIIIDFKGFVDNSKILKFYKDESIDLFINVSSSEGIPVSIMEVISYGIPVIATDVGGTSEIVDKCNGILIGKDFDVKNVAILIDKIINKKIYFDKQAIKFFWNKKFNAEKNYKDFTEYLQKVNK